MACQEMGQALVETIGAQLQVADPKTKAVLLKVVAGASTGDVAATQVRKRAHIRNRRLCFPNADFNMLAKQSAKPRAGRSHRKRVSDEELWGVIKD
eukprot:4212317-Alexandrium_andersonii.AAC.1